MAEKAQEFPVVLEKDGQKRTAHSVIAYNQLKTQGFTEGGSKSRTQSTRSAQKAKPAKAEEAKAEPKTETETEAKAPAKADEAK